MDNIKIEKIINGVLLENCYFIHEENEKIGFMVDPGYDTDKIINFLLKNEYKVDTILLTHAHFDHALGCHDIIEKYGARVFMSKDDIDILYNAEHNYSNLINKTSFKKIKIHKTLRDNEDLSFLGFWVKCISTPGHSKGGMSYYFPNEKMVFTGDTLHWGTYGRTDLYSSNIEQMKDSIKNKLFLLPNDTFVYPGHGAYTTIGKEKMQNEINNI